MYAHIANNAAQSLAAALRELGLEPLYSVEAHAVFVQLPDAVAQALRAKDWHFYDFVGGASRFMCSWKTDDTAVKALIGDLKEVLPVQSPMSRVAST